MILTPAGRLQRVAESGVERSNLILGQDAATFGVRAGADVTGSRMRNGPRERCTPPMTSCDLQR